jgi:peptide/nickel transport system substrate-binding protein
MKGVHKMADSKDHVDGPAETVSDIGQERMTRQELLMRGAAAGLSLSTIGPMVSGATGIAEAAPADKVVPQITTAYSTTPERLDQETTFAYASMDAIEALGEYLVRWKMQRVSNPSGGYEVAFSSAHEDFQRIIEPRLATSVDVSKDFRTYTIHLRKHVPSHAGNELTAQDVLYTWKRGDLMKGSGQYFDQVGSISNIQKAVKILDKYTLRVSLDHPNITWLLIQCNAQRTIYDSKEVKRHATAQDPWATKWVDLHDVGFGPFKLTSYRVGVEWSYELFKDYPFADKPNVQRVVNQAVPSGSQRVAALSRNTIDIAFQLTPRELQSLKATKGVKLWKFKGVNLAQIGLNPKYKPLQDVRVRQALAFATPTQAIVQNVLLGFGRRAKSIFPDVFPGTFPVWNYPYNIQKAKQLMLEAGHKSGFEQTFVYDSSDPLAELFGVIVRTSWAQIGVRLTLKAIPTSAYFQNLFAKSGMPIFYYANAPWDPDPGYDAFLNYSSLSHNNWWAYHNPAVDRMITQGQQIQNWPKRIAQFRKVQQQIARDVPVISIAQLGLNVATSNRIVSMGADPGDMMRWQELRAR